MRTNLPIAVCTLMLGACATAPDIDRMELSHIYNHSAKAHSPDRNPVVVVPGLLGTNLKDFSNEKYIWGGYDNLFADPAEPGNLRDLALPIGNGTELLRNLRDPNQPAGVLEKATVDVVGLPVQLEVYAEILRILGAGGYRDEDLGMAGAVDYGPGHFTCFQYGYDWRRDIVESAQLLGKYLRQKKEYVQERYREEYGIENADVKFDMVTHSMGGLVGRYYLMYGEQDLPEDGSLPELTWAGAEFVDRAILVAPPNFGSPLAFENLVNGKKFAPLTPEFPPALLASFPAAFELAPRGRHHLARWDGDPERPVDDILDPALWRKFGWGIMRPDQKQAIAELLPDIPPEDRDRVIDDHLNRILARTRQFHAALDRPARQPEDLDIIMIVGDGLETPKYLDINSETGAVTLGEMGYGDGTVLRNSAFADERMGGQWARTIQSPFAPDAAIILPGEHVEITKSRTFEDNLLHLLLEDNRGEVSSLSDTKAGS